MLAALSAGAPARAQSAQDTLNPRVTVLPGCTLVATDLNFGTPAPGTTAINTTSEVRVRCTNTTLYVIRMDRGDHANGQQRRMRGTSGDFVNYAIYRNAARTQDWGNSLLTGRLGISNALVPATYTVWGRVAGLNTATLRGSYQDSVTVTIEF